jgi:hypothetical protein
MTAPTMQARGPLELATLAEVDEETRNGFAPGAPHRAVVQQLVTMGKFAEAVRFVAFAMPRREGVWWAWVTAKRSAGADAPPPIKAALEATERWIAQPTDANRRQAFELAQQADIGTAAGCAGAAAFFAGESIAPANVATVPPGPHDASKMIAGAVLLSVLAKEPEKAPEKFLAAIQQGLDVITKIKLWPADEGAPPLTLPPKAEE